MSLHNAAHKFKESTEFICNFPNMTKYHSQRRSPSNFLTIKHFVIIIQIVFPNFLAGKMLKLNINKKDVTWCLKTVNLRS